MTYLRSTGVPASASTTRFNLVGKLPAGAAALMLGVSGLAMISGSAQAACAPATAGPDIVTCIGGEVVNFDSLGGDDDITILTDAGFGYLDISGGDDNDTISVLTAIGVVINGDLLGGSGNDTINLTPFGGVIVTVDNVDGEAGNDTITLDGSGVTVGTDILGGTGDDVINLILGTVGDDVWGEAGDDTIILNGASVTDAIGGDGFFTTSNDTIILLSGSAGQVLGGNGDDTITLDGATVTGNISGDADTDGADVINLLSGSLGGNALGDGGNDTITLDGLVMAGDIDGGTGDDEIDLLSGSVGNVLGGDGDDLIQMTGGAVTGSVLGQSGNDIFLIDDGSVNGSVLGGSGDDYIELGFNGPAATITGDMDGGSGDDTLVVLDGSVANVLGGTDNDLINIFGGTVTSDVNGGLGNDTINLFGGTVGGNIVGFTGSDTINLLSGSVTGFVFGSGGGGDDTITLDGATVGLGIFSGTGNDTVDLLSGSTSSANGQAGDDTLTLNGATVTGEIAGDAGNDTIDLLSGTVASVDGGLGNDMITLNGASIAGSIAGDAGDDIIVLLSGSAGSVAGSTGNDAITLNGASISGGITASSGNDVIDLLSGSANSVAGGPGDDIITLNGASIAGLLDGGSSGDDIFNLISGSFGGNLEGESGSDTATIFASYDMSTIVGNLDGGDDVSSADGFTDVLDIDASGTLTADNVINWEQIVIDNGNTVVLEGAALVTGGENAIGGNGIFMSGFSTLDLDDGLAITGDFESFSALSTVLASTAGGTGVYSVSGMFLMDGTLDMSGPVPGVGDVFIVGGTYDSFGGSTLLDANLDATETADSLDLNGLVIGSPNFLTIFDQGGPPSFTGTGPGNGIVLVDASGGFGIDDGDFALNPFAHPGGEILKVPFVYMLSLESDDILYLQSDVLAQVYGYAILAELMREDFPILRERLGDKRYNGFSGDGTDNDGAAGGGVGWDNGGIWARIEGTKRTNEHRGDFTTGEWEASRIEAEVGIDIPMNVGGGQGLFGISTHFIQGFADANSGLTPDPDVAEVDTTGFGAGLSFVYFPGGGFYADVQGRFTAWDADVEVDNRSIDQDINALGWGTSLEVGNRIAFGNTAVTPRGRAIYSDVSFESFTDDDGVKVKQEDSASVVVEGGVTVEQMFPDNGVTIFADASVSHDVLRDSAIDASGFTFDSGLVDTWGTVAIGGSMETGQGTSAFIAAEVSSPFGTTFGNSIGYGLRAGVRVDF